MIRFILCLPLLATAALCGCATHRDTVSGLPVHYHNASYGFTFYLPQDWAGCSVLTQSWEAPLYGSGDLSGTVVGRERGPVIVLRHPQWRTNAVRQDIPIMVFTREQWREENEGRFFPYAGGYIEELWRNRVYVFGVYSRYNSNDSVKGSQETDGILDRNRAIHNEPMLYPGT